MWRRWWNGMLLWCAASGRARVRLSELCHPAFRPRHSRASLDSRPATAHATAAATARSPKHSKSKPRQPTRGSSRHRCRHCSQPQAPQASPESSSSCHRHRFAI